MMLPNFLIAGAQKTATSWLSSCLAEHPDIFIPSKKEIFYFDKYFDRGIEWYKSQFEGWEGELMIGEATPNYIYVSEVPKRIVDSLGQIKIIVSLRHPVDRAYSAYWHYIKRGFFSRNSDFGDLFKTDTVFGLRTRGNYYDQLRRYYDYFPRENLLVLIQEETVLDSTTAVARSFMHLGVNDNYIPPTISKTVNKGGDLLLFNSQIYKFQRLIQRLPSYIQTPIMQSGRKLVKKTPIIQTKRRLDPILREALFQDYYAEDVAALRTLVEGNFSIWERPSSVRRP